MCVAHAVKQEHRRTQLTKLANGLHIGRCEDCGRGRPIAAAVRHGEARVSPSLHALVCERPRAGQQAAPHTTARLHWFAQLQQCRWWRQRLARLQGQPGIQLETGHPESETPSCWWRMHEHGIELECYHVVWRWCCGAVALRASYGPGVVAVGGKVEESIEGCQGGEQQQDEGTATQHCPGTLVGQLAHLSKVRARKSAAEVRRDWLLITLLWYLHCLP